MQAQTLPRTKFKQELQHCLSPDEMILSSQLWKQLMTGNLKSANRALGRAHPRIRDAVKAALWMRNEDGRDHENPFL